MNHFAHEPMDQESQAKRGADQEDDEDEHSVGLIREELP